MPTKFAPPRTRKKAARSNGADSNSSPENGKNGSATLENVLACSLSETPACGVKQSQKSGFRLLFASNPLPMYVFDVESLEFLELNDAAIRQYGFSREEFQRMKLTDIRPAEDVPRLLEALQGVRPGLHEAGQWRHRCKDGRIINVEITLHSLDFNGRNAALTVAQDITAKVQAEREAAEQAAHLHALVQNIPLAVVMLGDDYLVRMCNPAFERLFQYRESEVIGANIDDLIAPGELLEEAVRLSELSVLGKHVRATTRRRRKDGTSVDVDVHGFPYLLNGKLYGGFGIYEDIRDRKQAEEALGRLSRQHDLILNSVEEGIYGLDLSGKQTFVNAAGATMLGWEPHALVGLPGHEILHHSRADGSRYSVSECPIYAVMRDGETRHVTGEVFWRKDGTSFPVEYTSTPIYEASRLVGAVVTFKDVTEQLRAADARHEAEERYRSIFENAVEGFFQTTPEGQFLRVNPALARMYGYSSPEELVSRVREIARQVYVEPKRREEFKKLIEERGLVEGFEFQAMRKDGTRIWLSENARGVRDAEGKLLYYEGTVENVTERKRAEVERQVTYEIIHGVNVTENLDDLLSLIHKSLGKVLYAENCFVALHDKATGMFHFPFWVDKYDSVLAPLKLGKSCTEYVYRTGRAMLIPQEVFEKLAAEGEVELVGTNSPSWLGVPLRTPSETIGVLVVQHYESAGAYTERDLEFLASVGGQIALAIERKRAESALRESEARMRLLIEQLPAILWTTDNDLRFTSSLGAGLARLGLKQNQVIGMTLYEYFQTNDPDFPAIAAHRRAIAGEIVTYQTEWAGGSFACHSEPLRGADGKVVGTISMALDVTDRRQLEAQLRQSQKMEAVGRLAGGIAHDFNNLLMVIQGYTELLITRLSPEEPLRKHAEQIHEATDRAAGLTRQLLAFSRKQLLAPKVLDLREIVSDMEKMLRRLIGEDIELETSAPEDLWPIKADRSQIEQVILNLAVNARDAMPRGGKLTIETANAELDQAYSRQHPMVAPGNYVMLAVTDTGVGMNLETQAHAFEPFFTTKEKGKGTGLGLATVYGIVKQSGGYVWLYSEPGEGTSFKIYLPRVVENVSARDPQHGKEAPRRGSETILLVEDEKGVRELARDYLESTGYTVLVAEEGEAALRIAKTHGKKIHLLLTDVVMPGMSGRELAQQVQVLLPGTPIIYMSGYTDQAIVHHGILESDAILLQKPFTLNTLTRKLRQAIEAADESESELRRRSTPVFGSARTL
jgi:PAS domain S-box-containing protein